MSRVVGRKDNIAFLAKQHLDYPDTVNDVTTLDLYTDELKAHLEQYPEETNFRVKVEPRTGYGTVICLEPACRGAPIKLGRRDGAPDGGKRVGLGSLSAYQAHIISHAIHKASRKWRTRDNNASPVKAESRTKALKEEHTLTPIFKAGLPASSISSTSASRGSSTSHGNASSARPLVKPEPEERAVPRKRRSSLALNSLKSEENMYPSLAGLEPTPWKTPKLEPRDEIKLPLAEANRVPAPSLASSARLPGTNTADIEGIREKLAEVHSSLSRVQRELSKAEEKRRKIKADYTRIRRLQHARDELQAEKEALSSSLPAMRTSQPFGLAANTQIPPPFYNPAFLRPHTSTVGPVATPRILQPVASGSNVKLEGHAVKLDLDTGNRTAPLPQGNMNAFALGQHKDSHDEDLHADVVYGRNMYAGAVGKADDIDKFLIEAGNAEFFDENASVHEALRKLGLRALFQPLPGMGVALMPHQVIGVAWMLERENNVNFNGGILADDMGLGKTVQLISLMIKNTSQLTTRKSTLIVAPLALLDQWQFEIESKTDLGLKCVIYHGTNKPKRLDQLQKYDVVLTTFQTLAMEWPDDEVQDKEKRKRKRKPHPRSFVVDDSSEEERMAQKRKARRVPGLLFEMNWFRVVLDEAQNVRNRKTRASRAVSKLETQYRWCLTGTPIINSLADAYGLLRFLRIRPWYNWEDFNLHVMIHEKKNPRLATSRLQVIFAPVLLRRKKDSMLDGKPLVELPAKTVELCKLEFSQEEKDIYKMVETKSQAIFNRYLRAGTVLKNYYQVLVLLLRLRQVCSHPSLIQENGLAYIRPGEEADKSNRNAELLRAVELVGSDFVGRVREKYRAIAVKRLEAEKESVNTAVEEEDLECPVCLDSFTDPVITNCEHAFCRECILGVLHNAPQEDRGDSSKADDNNPRCPSCRAVISKKCLFSRAAFEPTEAELTNEDSPITPPTRKAEGVETNGSQEPRRSARKSMAPRQHVLYSDEQMSEAEDEEDDMSDFIVESDQDEEEKDARRAFRKQLWKGKRRARPIILDSDDEYDEDIIHGAQPDLEGTPEEIALMPKFLPSTKMKFMMESIRRLAEEHPDEKVLVISQWTQCLQLVSDFLTEHGFLHVKYQGDMSRNKRDQAVRCFMAKDKASIMLMSLKCGGVGLNLTRANHVISLDLGWSLAVEQQAYDRVHRLGQHRPVHVRRLVISNTVEDRILALQERKKNLADGTFGEGGGKRLGKLSVKELANLFGLDVRGCLLD